MQIVIAYKKLSASLEKMGYVVVPINPDWKKPISEQIIPVDSDSIIFGFSMGAVLAYLIAQKYPCKKIILASISPTHTFVYKSFLRFMKKHMSEDEAIKVTKDVVNIKVKLDTSKTPHITLMGSKEKLTKGERKPDFIVPGADHKIDKVYSEAILKLLA